LLGLRQEKRKGEKALNAADDKKSKKTGDPGRLIRDPVAERPQRKDVKENLTIKTEPSPELATILQRLRENEKIHQKFYILESRILSILNLQDFFEILLTEMGRIFIIPFVWLSVIKKSSLADLINPLIHSRIIIEKTQFLDKRQFDRVFANTNSPVLFSGDLSGCSVFLPGSDKYRSGSMAIAPVRIDGEIVGSLNQWDPSPRRFKPDLDTSFLDQLMIKVSLCLSNVAAHEKLKYFAFHDPLTGCLNRRAFETALSREFSRAKRHFRDLSLVFMDVDKFKQINDHYGHDVGDKALAYIAETIQSLVRDEDILARYAGDEFILILPETPAPKADILIRRVRSCLNDYPLKHKDSVIPLSVSCGISSIHSENIERAADLIKIADIALYSEKARKTSAIIP
jgi:diguanylate cyclase (GGDEF)-like protein